MCKDETARELIGALREYFCVYGVPEQLASDGASVYTEVLVDLGRGSPCVFSIQLPLKPPGRDGGTDDETVDRGEHGGKVGPWTQTIWRWPCWPTGILQIVILVGPRLKFSLLGS